MASERAPSVPPASATRRGRPRGAALAAWGVGLFLAVTAASLWWLLATEPGLRASLALAARWAPFTLDVQGARGAWTGPLHVDRLVFDNGSLRLELEGVDVDYLVRFFGTRGLHVRQLQLRSARLLSRPAKKEPARLPASLRLPIVLDVDRADVEELVWLDPVDRTPLFRLRRLGFGLHTAAERHRLEDLSLRYEGQGAEVALRGEGNIAVEAPYPLDARLVAEGQQRGQGFAAVLTARNTLAEPLLHLRAEGRPAAGAAIDRRYALQGEAEAHLAPFAGPRQVPVKALKLKLRGVDPSAWSPRAPQAALSLTAELSPEGAAGTQGWPAAAVGQLEIANDLPGPIDRQRLPVERLQTALRWQAGQDAGELRLTNLDAAVAGGTVTGSLRVRSPRFAPPAVQAPRTSPPAAPAPTAPAGPAPAPTPTPVPAPVPAATGLALRFEGELRLARIDLAQLLSSLQSSRLDATITARGDERTQSVDAQWSDPRFTARTVFDLSWPRLTVSRADLRSRRGLGEASLAGHADLSARRFAVKGEMRHFDPSVIAAMPAASLSATLEATGSYGTNPAGDLTFALKDSWLSGMPGQPAWREHAPLSGQGRVRLAQSGARTGLAADVELALAGNRATLKGALGSPGDRLRITADVATPGLFVPGTSGRLHAESELVGALDRLAMQGRAAAEGVGLRRGEGKEARVTTLRHGEVRWQFEGLDALAWRRMKRPNLHAFLGRTRGEFEATAVDLALPTPNGTVVRTARLTLAGEASRHRLTAAADTAAQDTAQLVLEGGLLPDDRWEGSWQRFEAQSPTQLPGRRVLLQRPAALTLRAAAAGREAALGQAVIDVVPLSGAARAPMRVQVDALVVGAEHLVTRGRLSGWPLVREAGGLDLPSAADVRAEVLHLGGDWDLRIDQTMQGQVRLYRESGDLYLDVERRQPAGLTTLTAELLARPRGRDGADLVLTAHASGTRVGRVDAEARGGLGRRSGAWALLPEAPLDARLVADMPQLDWIGPTLGGRTQTGGRLRADIALRDAADSRWSATGTVEGSGLLLTMLDTGVRLQDGTLHARVQGQTLTVDQLRFVSRADQPPRALLLHDPQSARLAGTVEAKGRLDLGTRAGTFEAVADRFLAVQRKDRWLALSGALKAELEPRLATVSGQVRLDPGYIAYDRRTTDSPAPALSEDIVVKGRSPAPAKPSAFQLQVDVLADLGPQLYFQGEGLDARLAGQVRVRSERGANGRLALRAFGSVAVQEGSFEAYGQKLAIERGILNFQGPIDNPGLNVLAVRKGLQVEAGVSIGQTAKNPDIRLVSDPVLPDLEKLSWLVLGRPPDQAGSADAILLLSAARDLASHRRGPSKGIAASVAERFGLDQLSVGSGRVGGSDTILAGRTVAGDTGLGSTSGTLGGAQPGAVSSQIFSAGKRLSSKLTLSYEQAIAGTASIVRLTYRINDKLSAIAKAGTENALDLVYVFAFD